MTVVKTTSVSGLAEEPRVKLRVVPRATWRPARTRRRVIGIAFMVFAALGPALGIAALIYLLQSVAAQGLEALTWDFLNNFPSRFAHKAGVKAALFGSAYIALLTGAFCREIVAGIGDAATRGLCEDALERALARLGA